MSTGTKKKIAAWNSIICICIRALHTFLSFVKLLRSLYRHPYSAEDHLHTGHPTQPRPTSYPPSTCMPSTQFQPYGTTNSLHVAQPFLYSVIHSISQLPFIPALLCMHLFIPNSTHASHSHQTSQTLISRTFNFLLKQPCLFFVQNAIGTILLHYVYITSSHLSPILNIGSSPVWSNGPCSYKISDYSLNDIALFHAFCELCRS